MTAKTATLILEFFDKYLEHFKELHTFYLKKQEKAYSDDLIWLLDSLAEEQRLIMRGQSLERKRLLVFKENGIEGFTSKMLIENSPEDYKGRFRMILAAVEKEIDIISSTNSATLDVIERKLDIQADIAEKDGIFTKNDTYTSKGAKVHKTPNVTDSYIIGSI